MNSVVNLENIQQQCRICLKNGDINIWSCKVALKGESERNDNSFYMDDLTETSFIEMIDIFFNSKDFLNFTEEFPLLCRQCLKDLKFCHIFYEKLKLSSKQLKLYQESLNQSIEEEHLIEENEINNLDTNMIESPEEAKILNLQLYESDNAKELPISKHITLDKNDSFIVTQFIPETLKVTDEYSGNDTTDKNEELRPSKYLFTVNLKAVEVKSLEDLDRQESSQPLSNDITEPAIYICQYCPQAFTKSDYLKTHIQKSHVCKFCTQPFIVTEDLFSHIREVHTKHKCAICHKLLSSGTNLRHHIERVHGVKLPPKVTLIDFVKSTSPEEDLEQNEMEILEELKPKDVCSDENYVWKNDDCIEVLTETNSGEIN